MKIHQPNKKPSTEINNNHLYLLFDHMMELTYFDFGFDSGVFYSLRLNHAGVDFKDNRLKFPEYKSLKKKGIFLPVCLF